MRNLSVLGANEEYVEQTKAYGRKDVILAFILYAVMLLMFWLMGNLFVQKWTTITETYIFCVTGIISFVLIGLVFLFCTLRKQKLETVGFSKSQAKKSFKLGISLFLVAVIVGGIIPILSGSTIRTDIVLSIMRVIYYLVFIAFMEELVYRGFIGTRLFGYFNNKLLSIAIVGIMFSLMHIPFQMQIIQASLLEFLSANWGSLLQISLLHFLFQWLYSKYNSIIAPTILHFIWDYIQWFVI